MEVIMFEDIYESISQAAKKRNLRDSTIDAYYVNTEHFLRTVNKPATLLEFSDAEAFLTIKRLEGISPATYNRYRAAIRFLYKKALHLEWNDDELPPMKQDKTLPTILSREEINAIIEATKNLKHKAIIATMYSSGLRVSEVTHLHYEDISRTNMTVHVRNSKSRNDRYTILSKRNLDLLTEYWFNCGRPMDILFPSSWNGGYLCKEGINNVFKRSAKRAGITRHVSTHACRHSFASHLYEEGLDIRCIQSLLGHASPLTTEVYVHVSNRKLLGVQSPYDLHKGGEK